jgi:hypothetical protein
LIKFNEIHYIKINKASQKDLAVKEIRNGRLAMWAAAGILLQVSLGCSVISVAFYHLCGYFSLLMPYWL